MPNYEKLIRKEGSALIVWDVQEALISRIFNKDEFFGNVKKLLAEARKLPIPVFYTKITPLPEKFESPIRRAAGFSRFQPGDIPDEIRPASEDIVLNKNTASIFIGTNFELMTRNAGIKTLIFTGIATEMGIETSARHAQNLGYLPVIVEDGVSSSDKEAHERSLKNMAKLMPVIKTDGLIKTLRA
ncbi:MAG: isochorismatase family cysteine hydrolase [Thermoplasmataceae archaeon]